MELFPLNTGVSELRGLVKLIKDNGNAIEISQLARETKRQIDALLPIIDACRLLGLCTIKGGAVELTDSGINLTGRNMRDTLSKSLVRIEPFKSSFSILKSQRNATTGRLSERLRGGGIMLYSERVVNAELLKRLLLEWAVRLGVLSYNPKNDAWYIA